MKKKISLILLILIFALSFTGCESNKKSTIEYDATSLEEVSDKIIDSFSQMQTEDFDKFLEGSDLEIDLTLLQAGLPVD
ncbi:MAG: sodium pump decarboxylase, gamma subunit, partial [Lachnospiraceae bacterium]|nr:sodium pump decarboxylase, gamma subunit [Lachnospiraceae bacterium]